MRKWITTQQLYAWGCTKDEIAWAVRRERLLRAQHGIFADAAEGALSDLDTAVARSMTMGEPATGLVAGAVYGLDAIEDSVVLVPRRRRAVMFGGEPQVVNGVLVAHGLQVVVELAASLDDLRWEQALESGLRKRLFRIEDLEHLLPELSGSRTHGAPRIRRVLRLRPAGAPATGSMMETLMVQHIRNEPGIPEPDRQVEVYDEGEFVARVDLAWCDLGAFNELDGQQHKDQPVHDARRESAVVAATGWLVGRFTWREVRYLPVATGRRLAKIIERARARPVRAL